MWYQIRRTSGSLMLGLLSLALGLSAVVIVLLTTQTEPTAQAVPIVSPGKQGLQPAATSVEQASQPINAEDVIAALNCARAQQSLPPYERLAEFDREAQRRLITLQTNGQQRLDASEATFPFIGQLLLNNAANPTGCTIGGFDTTRIRDLSKATRVGVAVADVQSGAQPQMTLAVIVGR